MTSIEKRLGDVAEIMVGMTGFVDSGKYRYRVVQPNSFNDMGVMSSADVQWRNDEIAEKQMLSVGDILVKRLNPSFVHVVGLDSVGMVASQNILVVRPNDDIDPSYLGYLLEQKDVIGQVEHVTGSAAAIKAVSVKKLAGITIPVIPIYEQRKVGAIWKLSRRRKQLLNEYMTENDRLISLLASNIINGGGKK